MKIDILAIASHPDDVELSCAGTLMVHKAMGKKVGVLDLTRGELGTRGTVDSRKREARAAAKVLGLTIRENLGLADGFFENDRITRLKLIRMIRKYQPDIILANAPQDRHPDHGRAARLITESCFLSGLLKIRTSLQGKLQEAWRPLQVFHFIQDRYLKPDFVVDITNMAEKKWEAIRCYQTQFLAARKETVQTYISTPEFFNSVIHRAAMMGKMIGVKYGEGFITEKMVGVRSLYDMIL
ncbi:MAG TPA: bacillithiol biosynthesis deacetylase BshB1 [Chitinophagaceae bacterium]|nr:bacillithiol biosynthesis deacetylase BshB1 [Chitinophagaceae bacterium]